MTFQRPTYYLRLLRCRISASAVCTDPFKKVTTVVLICPRHTPYLTKYCSLGKRNYLVANFKADAQLQKEEERKDYLISNPPVYRDHLPRNIICFDPLSNFSQKPL